MRSSIPCIWVRKGGQSFDVQSASCVGVCASRTSALAGERHGAFLAIVGEERPAFRPIRACRPLPVEACNAVGVPVVRLAGEAGCVQGGNVSTDGTNIPGQASRHQAMRDGERTHAVDRLRAAIAAWVTQASQQDEADAGAWGSRRGDALPEAWARRAARLATSAAAMPRWAAHAQAEA